MQSPRTHPRPILIADDTQAQRVLLGVTLRSWGHAVTEAADGLNALKAIQDPLGPTIAILDWVMPGIEGIQLCRWVRQHLPDRMLYLILLTSRSQQADLVAGLEAGADDFLAKPFNAAELRARIRGAERIIRLHEDLSRKQADLRSSYHRIMRLEKMMPICSYCKSIRDDKALWRQVDEYLVEHADARFSHGVCPTCFDRVAREDFGLDPESLVDEPVSSEDAAPEGAPAGKTHAE